MDGAILYSLVTLGIIAVVSAVVLFVVAKKFKVEEDPRIDEVLEFLPGANCGGCGFPGCRGLAEGIIKAANAGSSDIPCCPGCDAEKRKKIGEVIGLAMQESVPKVAVIRCGGTCEKTTRKSDYDGPANCAVATSLFVGEKGCQFGCLGLGDCVSACAFGALSMDKTTGLPVVNEEKCTSCGVCAKKCPRKIIEIRPKGRNNRRVYVGCRNTDKAPAAMSVCKAACIGCGKCAKECPEKVQAITVENFLAYIDPAKCIACGKCASACPTHAIKATFEIKVAEKPAEAKPAAAPAPETEKTA
ncbi:RnfABCDGE type electron transport complex subunit B [bacterium]|nr:RnfABCDGE type electron transport complex subunit B [bacterium]